MRRALGLSPLTAALGKRLLRDRGDGEWTEEDVRRVEQGQKGAGRFTEKPRAHIVPSDDLSAPSVDLIRQQAAIARPGSIDDLLAVGDMARRRAAAATPGLTGEDPDSQPARTARLEANLKTLNEIAGSIDPEVLRPKVEAGAARFDEEYPDGAEVIGIPVSRIMPSGKRRLTEAMARYPQAWAPAVADIFDSSAIGNAPRAFFQTETGKASDNLIAAPMGSVLNGLPAEAITLHEVGHGLETRIEGLKEAQTEFWKRRVGGDASVVHEDHGHFPAHAESPTKDRYSMKRYENETGELFTTGVEDLLGSGALHMLGTDRAGEVDEDFANFIWGALLTLRPKGGGS